MFSDITEILFRISGDSTPGQTALAEFQAALARLVVESKGASTAMLYDWAGNPIQGLGADFAGAAAGAEAGRRGLSARAERREWRSAGWARKWAWLCRGTWDHGWRAWGR
jgi:hypothetical protein